MTQAGKTTVAFSGLAFIIGAVKFLGAPVYDIVIKELFESDIRALVRDLRSSAPTDPYDSGHPLLDLPSPFEPKPLPDSLFLPPTHPAADPLVDEESSSRIQTAGGRDLTDGVEFVLMKPLGNGCRRKFSGTKVHFSFERLVVRWTRAELYLQVWQEERGLLSIQVAAMDWGLDIDVSGYSLGKPRAGQSVLNLPKSQPTLLVLEFDLPDGVPRPDREAIDMKFSIGKPKKPKDFDCRNIFKRAG